MENYDYDHDHLIGPSPLRLQQPGYIRAHLPQQEWSIDDGHRPFGDDGGAIARYLEEQERGHPSHLHTAGPAAEEPWDSPQDEYELGREYGQSRSLGHQRVQREPSDISVEALDLADYTQTLRGRSGPSRSPHNFPSLESPTARESYSRYPAVPASQLTPDYDDAPPLDRPFSAQSVKTRYSDRTTVSAPAGSPRLPPPPRFRTKKGYSIPSSRRADPRRLTMPPQLATNTTRGKPAIFSATASNSSHGNPPNWQQDPDVRTFPKWSRGWYDQTPPPPFEGSSQGRKSVDAFVTRQTGFANPTHRPLQEADIGVWPPQAMPDYDPVNPYPTSSPVQDPGILPWGHSSSHLQGVEEPPQYLPESVKEERMRMLEKEFGQKAMARRSRIIHGETPGTMNSEGRLVTDGPKRRAAVRWMQVLLALAAAGSGIYGAIAIHPTPKAPPAGSIQAYILYVLSVVTFLFAIYLFLIQPCLRGRKRRRNDKYTQGMGLGPGGMMVLPVVQGLGMGNKKKAKKAKKKGKGQPGPGEGVQVNLIVDPSMLGGGSNRRDRDEDESISENDSEEGMNSSKRAPKPRRSVFQALAMEEDWRAARRLIKWHMFADVVLMLLWGAEFVYIMIGKRCPPGGFGGWCNAYNVASAAACLLTFAFGFGIYYDIRDLSLSKVSPRTRP